MTTTACSCGARAIPIRLSHAVSAAPFSRTSVPSCALTRCCHPAGKPHVFVASIGIIAVAGLLHPHGPMHRPTLDAPCTYTLTLPSSVPLRSPQAGRFRLFTLPLHGYFPSPHPHPSHSTSFYSALCRHTHGSSSSRGHPSQVPTRAGYMRRCRPPPHDPSPTPTVAVVLKHGRRSFPPLRAAATVFP